MRAPETGPDWVPLAVKCPGQRGQLDPHAQSGAPVAQLDRAPGYEPGGREFESLRARQKSKSTPRVMRSQVRGRLVNNTRRAAGVTPAPNRSPSQAARGEGVEVRLVDRVSPTLSGDGVVRARFQGCPGRRAPVFRAPVSRTVWCWGGWNRAVIQLGRCHRLGPCRLDPCYRGRCYPGRDRLGRGRLDLYGLGRGRLGPCHLRCHVRVPSADHSPDPGRSRVCIRGHCLRQLVLPVGR